MTNTRNYRTPGYDDDADVPLWNDRLAQDVAKDVDAVESRSAQPMNHEELLVSFMDLANFRGWLEMKLNGKPSDYAAELVAESQVPYVAAEVAEQVAGLPLPVPMSTESGYVAVWVDLADRVAFGIRADGSTTAGTSSAPAPADPATVILPASIPLVVGRTYRLNYAELVEALGPELTVTVSSSGNGKDLGTYWECTPAAAGTFTLAVSVWDRAGALVTSKSVPVTKYAAPSGAGKRHLAIGDSITRAGNYVGSALTSLAGAASVGTRTYNDGALCVEGRGGWTLDGYMTRFGHTMGDSPFLFPAGISGGKYLGNVAFWKSVCHTDPNGYDYQGFQKIAKGWTGTSYLYGTDGYPLAPTEGDVVVDPAQAAGATIRQYTSGAWAAMSPQPAVEFSFSKYMARYAAAHAAGAPTSISLMLETNDFFSGIDDAKFTAWLGKLNTVIASVRAYSATVPFVVLLAPTGGPSIYWGDQATVSKFKFDKTMQEAARRILAAVQTPAMEANKVRVASFLGAVAPANMADHVHPVVPAGHDQMAPWLAGMLAKLTTEGL